MSKPGRKKLGDIPYQRRVTEDERDALDELLFKMRAKRRLNDIEVNDSEIVSFNCDVFDNNMSDKKCKRQCLECKNQ